MFTDISDKLREKVEKCNIINLSDKGAGEMDSVNVEEYIKKWKLHRVDTGDKNFTILGDNVQYNLVKMDLNSDMDTSLVVIPGYSEKSICWTIGRMNHYINKHSDIFNKYKNIWIFDLSNAKSIQGKLNDIIDKDEKQATREIFDIEMSIHLTKIIKNINDNIVLLGRSAGGGQAVRVTMLHKNIKKLLLMAPGYVPTEGLCRFVKTFKENPIPIVLSSVDKDPTVKHQEVVNMYEDLVKGGYGAEHKFIPIKGGTGKDSFDHRIKEELIKEL